MSKVTISEAVKMVNVSQTTLYRDMKEGKFSADTDTRGKKVVDVAELIRVYGAMHIPDSVENNGNSQKEAIETDEDSHQDIMVNN